MIDREFLKRTKNVRSQAANSLAKLECDRVVYRDGLPSAIERIAMDTSCHLLRKAVNALDTLLGMWERRQPGVTA